VVTRAAGQGALQVSPSFVMSSEQVTDLADHFGGVLEQL
jgi:hypothetical protein